MKLEDLLLFGAVGLLLYVVFRGQSSSSIIQPGPVVPGMPSPISSVDQRLSLLRTTLCPPGQFMFHTGPLGLGPGYCSSTIPDVLS